MTANINQRVNMAAASDVGTARKDNEDSLYYSEAKNFFIVCDGMGGHEKGALASKIGCETLRDLLFAKDTTMGLVIKNTIFDVAKAGHGVNSELPHSAQKIIAGIRLANRRILANCFGSKRMQGMGTTLVAGYFHQGHIIIAHVGDSRLYRLRRDVLTCLTTDHSWLNELLEDKEISEKDAEHFKKKNVLTRALGISATVKIDLQIDCVEPDDLYLACSDGLYNALSGDLLKSILTAYHGSLQNKVTNLVNRAKMMDGSDNITAGLMHIAGTGEATTELFQEKLTVPPEQENITDYLNQVVKNIYPVRLASNSGGKKRLRLAGAVAAAVLLAGLLLFYTSTALKSKPAGVQTALFTENITPVAAGQRPSSAPVENAGQIALVQITAPGALLSLEEISGVRVLDSISELRSGKPISAGTYTWALADAYENIIYKKENISLEPLNNYQSIQDGQEATLDEFTASNNAAERLHPQRSLIFLAGNFESADYQDASIFINDKRFGPLMRFRDSGFHLSRGVYDIKIVSSKKKVLKQKSQVKINRGETLALEF